MTKTEEILELEEYLQTELYLANYNKDFLQLNRSVNLDDDNKIIALNLSYLQISDLKPLGKLTSLQSLYLDSNSINDLTPLTNLKNLKFLSLNENHIENLKPLSELKNIEVLHLNKNYISEITPLKDLEKIKILNISLNNLVDISVVKNFKNIRAISANNNCIIDISSIVNLKALERISFANNEIQDVSCLKKMKNLFEFIFTNNFIFDLSFLYHLITKGDFTRNYNFYENPLVYPPTEEYLKGEASMIQWFKSNHEKANILIKQCLKNKTNSLDLSFCGISDLTLIPKLFTCIHIEELILSNEWAEYNDKDWVKISKSPKYFSIKNNLYEIPTQISKLKNLKKLIVGGDWENNENLKKWRIKDIKYIGKLTNLEVLNISNNQITSINVIKNLTNLKNIYANNNKITSIVNLENLNQLKSLNLSNNYLSNTSFLKKTKSIEMLDLHSNKLKDINDLEILLTSIKKIIIDNNPIAIAQNWKLSKYENHYSTIENYFSKKHNDKNRIYKLPIKVLLLGNHGAGKSTLLNYLTDTNKNRKIIPATDSTHIIRIENFPKTSKNKLPEIIYFDFGGQDYYHGIYKAFLTNDSINILLWNDKNDKNKIRIDIKKNILTRDFTKEYWLNQLKYNYADKFNNYDDALLKDDIILTVQTHADKDLRITGKNNVRGIKISNEFFIALNQDAIERNKINKINLDYLESNLKYEIEKKKDEDRFNISQPLWYGKFLNYIFNYSSEKCINLKDLLKKYNRKPKANETSHDILNFLMEDLDQLHRQGLILYYKDFSELNDVAWLNPSLLTKYIHKQILTTQDLIESRGNVSEEKFLTIAGNDKKIIQLLQLQKVIFHNKESKNYIIPSFLPLANDIRVKNNYDILTFGLDNPAFVLKFEKFIPFGIVNQLICHFGNNPDSKNFWRDQLIFTLNNSIKVLIKLDFNNLEISVFLNNKNLENSKLLIVERYIFTCLIAIYYDIPLLTFMEYLDDQIKINSTKHDQDKKDSIERNSITSNFIEIINKVPDDLFLSLDNQRFVKVTTLNSITDEFKILSYKIDSAKVPKNNEINEDSILRILSPEKTKELPIYKFQNFTNKPLKKMKKIFISYSKDDLTLVNEFQDHLSSLKRDNIIATWYCTELLAGGEWDKDISLHFDQSDIVCFMVSSNLMRTEYIHKYEIAKAFERKKNDVDFKIVPIILDFCSWNTQLNNLGDFTALPYTAKPVCDFDNKNMAWYIVVECIRFMIESNEQPVNDEWFWEKELPKSLKNIFERIVNKTVDKSSKP